MLDNGIKAGLLAEGCERGVREMMMGRTTWQAVRPITIRAVISS